jgi:hypothetical protein
MTPPTTGGAPGLTSAGSADQAELSPPLPCQCERPRHPWPRPSSSAPSARTDPSSRLRVIRAYPNRRPWPILPRSTISSLSPIDDDDPSTRIRDGFDRERGTVHAPQSRRRSPTGMQLDADEYGRLHDLAAWRNCGFPPARDLSAQASPPMSKRAKPAES